MDVKTLLALAQNATDVGNTKAAAEFYEVALARSPNNLSVLEAYAELLIHHTADAARAREMLRHAISLDPHRGHVKYLNLAQLSDAAEALECYHRARELVARELSRSQRKRRRAAALRETLATVHCAVAELYLTDLCFAPEAESACAAALSAALGADAACIEAHQLLASLRLSQSRPAEAAEALGAAVALTHRLAEARQPTYASKVELARLLMQADPDAAFRFLLELLQLGDNNPYVWFLLGETARIRRRYPDAARLMRRARVMLTLGDDSNAAALQEVDASIAVLVEEMGGPAAVAQVAEMDHPNPIELLAPEEEEEGGENGAEHEDEDEAEPEWESCEEEEEGELVD